MNELRHLRPVLPAGSPGVAARVGWYKHERRTVVLRLKQSRHPKCGRRFAGRTPCLRRKGALAAARP